MIRFILGLIRKIIGVLVLVFFLIIPILFFLKKDELMERLAVNIFYLLAIELIIFVIIYIRYVCIKK